MKNYPVSVASVIITANTTQDTIEQRRLLQNYALTKEMFTNNVLFATITFRVLFWIAAITTSVLRNSMPVGLIPPAPVDKESSNKYRSYRSIIRNY